jgi:hypothetical protein
MLAELTQKSSEVAVIHELPLRQIRFLRQFCVSPSWFLRKKVVLNPVEIPNAQRVFLINEGRRQKTVLTSSLSSQLCLVRHFLNISFFLTLCPLRLCGSFLLKLALTEY